MENKTEYSIVIPVYNSEFTLDELHQRIADTFEDITENYEIIFIDDCSVDNSWNKLIELFRNKGKITVIHLAKNCGQNSTILCGLNHCKGDYIIIMDDDLQNPPEEIPRLVKKIHEGYWVVYGEYIIKNHNKIENIFSYLFKRFVYLILDIPRNIYISNFVICKSDVVKKIITIKTAYPLIEALIIKNAPTNKITNVSVVHNKRNIGKSNYNFFKYIRIGLDLFINHSSLPLQLAGISGIFISILSISYGISIVIRSILDPSYGIMGWNSLMVATTFLSGCILIFIGIIGEYLHRILTEISCVQPYVISEMYI